MDKTQFFKKITNLYHKSRLEVQSLVHVTCKESQSQILILRFKPVPFPLSSSDFLGSHKGTQSLERSASEDFINLACASGNRITETKTTNYKLQYNYKLIYPENRV